MAINPFSVVTKDDMLKYAGQVLALCPTEPRILAVASTAAALSEAMRRDYPGVTYARLALPSGGSDVRMA